ncbi:MAG: SH3 domain-containing protein [Alphaproteobacteria bacterium]|nr:SH3 domain-containing protein [Alphaproteobacteria bacterium]
MALVSQATVARVAPKSDSAKAMAVPAGTIAAIEDGAEGWYLTSLDVYGTFGKGWLHHDFLTIDPPSRKDGTVWPLPAQIKSDTLLRDGAGIWGNRIDRLKEGTRVRVVERNQGWYRIDEPKAGWIAHADAYIDVRLFLNAR